LGELWCKHAVFASSTRHLRQTHGVSVKATAIGANPGSRAGV
jgi:hypothetical protein